VVSLTSSSGGYINGRNSATFHGLIERIGILVPGKIEKLWYTHYKYKYFR
jgi:hypothetical protein